MTEPKAIYTKKGPVAYLTLNRPQKINAMDGEMYELIADAIADYGDDKDLHCMIMSGAGGNFSSGGDIAYLRDQRVRAKEKGKVFQYDFPAFKALDRLAKPVVAALDGYCIASGFNMSLLYCDIRIATPRLKMGHPSSKRGLTSPGNLGIYPMPFTWYMGLGNALYMMLMGKLVNGEEALRMGLVNEVVPVEDLMKRADEIAQVICESSPRVIAAQKALLRRFQEVPGSFYLRLREMIFGQLDDADYMEGTAAFLEKRKPNYAKD